MNDAEIRQEIRKRSNGGTVAALAREWGVSPQYLHDVVKNRRKPGRKLLKGMGLIKKVEYVQA